MKKIFIAIAIMSISPVLKAETHKIQLSPNDKFTVSVPSEWKLKQKEYEKEKSATFYIDPKDSSFSLTMVFLRKNENLDSPDKLKRVIIQNGKSVLPRVVENSVQVKRIKLKKSYGFYATFTDKDTAKLSNPKPTDFLYMTRGYIRLSDDSVLGFMMLTHKINDDLYKKLGNYLAGYIK